MAALPKVTPAEAGKWRNLSGFLPPGSLLFPTLITGKQVQYVGRTQGHPRICSLRGLLVEPSSLALCWTLSQESRTQLKQALGPAHHGHLTVVRVCPAVGHCEQNGLKHLCDCIAPPGPPWKPLGLDLHPSPLYPATPDAGEAQAHRMCAPEFSL